MLRIATPVFASLCLILTSLTANSTPDASELRARSENYAKAQEKELDRQLRQKADEGERRFQQSGGRESLRPGLVRALSRAVGSDMSDAYWQGTKLKNGRWIRGEVYDKMAIITNRGFYCLKATSGWTRSNYNCFYDNGAPYLSFEHNFARDGQNE